MPEANASRKAYEIATAIICRKDGSCRRLLKQKDENGVVTVLMDKFYLPGTFVDSETGEVLRGPGACKRWTQAYTPNEIMQIAIANIKARTANLLRSVSP